MNERTLQIKNYTDEESLKTFILQKLNLLDHKKDCVKEFYDRLKNYIDRNRNLKIIIQVDRETLEKDLEFKLSLKKFQQPFPDSFEMGNPLNRWLYDPVMRTPEEAKREELDFEKNYKEKLLAFNQFIDKLGEIGNGQICVRDS